MSYTVAVRALCEFTAKAGDLDLRFTPVPSAQEGIDGHAVVTGRRPAGYEREVALEGKYGELRIRGRADGYDPLKCRVEEIKTYRGDLARMPANHRALHWAQARVYGWLLCQSRALAHMEVALVYFDIGSQKETILTEERSAAELEAFFNEQCARFLAWSQQEDRHRAARDGAMAALPFPHAGFRRGQRSLAETVFKANALGRCLLAQAPTGIGKTLGTLFPLLKSMKAEGEDALDKIFYLAAKTPGRGLALDAVATLKRDGAPLRVLELVARDKACEHPDKACHGESCPLAQGFYDRLPGARAEAMALPAQDKAALRELALRHEVCPFYLGQELARWADVIVGDYNYFFDGSAMLHYLTVLNKWKVAVLVDEAHNLLERSRANFSAALEPQRFKTAKRALPPRLKKPFARLTRSWNALAASMAADYEVREEIPEDLLFAVQNANAALGEFFADFPEQMNGPLTEFYFEALHFQRMAEVFGEHSLFDLSSFKGLATPCIRNVLPAPFLAPRFASAQSVTLFSATLSPWHFHADTLGLPADAGWLDVESPFEAAQLEVRIAPRISTRYAGRAASLAPIAKLMARQFHERPGNYLAFFSSYDYLEQAAAKFADSHPDIPQWRQARGMGEAERSAFLDRFSVGGQGIGFAVLGGAFAEGIDLPGERLVGAFIATLGLPQLNPVNEQMRERMERLFGAGYDYTYLYPGLTKVVQAAGRVIRTVEDRGTVWLMDDRFARAEVRALLPAWWEVGISS